MVENLENIISGGFHTWSRNINLAIPLLINELIQLFILVLSLALGMLMIFGVDSAQEIAVMTEDEIATLIMSSFQENISALIIMAVLVFGILLLFESYFTAGVIGMAKTATNTGDTGISDMVASGSKNFVHVFLANILLALVKFAGVIVVVPGALLFRNNLDLVESTQLAAGILLLVVGIGIWVLYMLILDIILKPVLYVIVIDNMDAVDGIVKGFRFFMENKLSVFLIWLFIVLISIIVTMLFYFISYFISIFGIEELDIAWSLGSQLLIVLTLHPLVIVWWTRLYMVRTGKKIFNNDLLSVPWAG